MKMNIKPGEKTIPKFKYGEDVVVDDNFYGRIEGKIVSTAEADVEQTVGWWIFKYNSVKRQRLYEVEFDSVQELGYRITTIAEESHIKPKASKQTLAVIQEAFTEKKDSSQKDVH